MPRSATNSAPGAIVRESMLTPVTRRAAELRIIAPVARTISSVPKLQRLTGIGVANSNSYLRVCVTIAAAHSIHTGNARCSIQESSTIVATRGEVGAMTSGDSPVVGVIMGSKSDWEHMSAASEVMTGLKVSY